MAKLRLPRLPKEVWGPAGPILVRRQRRLIEDNGDPADALWVEWERTIYIEQRVALQYAWTLVFHEQTHAWFADMRYEFGKQEEDLCNHLANCRMQLMLRNLEKGVRAVAT